MRLVLVLHTCFVSLTVNSRNGEMNWPSKVIKYVCIKEKNVLPNGSRLPEEPLGFAQKGKVIIIIFFLFNGCFVFVHGLQHYHLVVGNLSALKLVFFHSIVLGLVNHTSWLCGQYL